MEIIKINGKIQIICDDGSTTEGMVIDKTDDSVDFSIPSDDKKFRLLHIGERVQALAFNESKGISFYGLITKRAFLTVPTYKISGLFGFRKVQRRENVRVPIIEYIKYISCAEIKKLNPKMINADGMLENFMKKAVMLDISAGGMKFCSSENLYEGEEILCKISICGECRLFTAVIVHKHLAVNPDHTTYFYGVRFKEIDEKTKDCIVKYVFQIMREQIKNR